MLTMYRTKHDTHCLSELILPDGQLIYVLERPWLDNEPFVSCVPAGQYIVDHDTTGQFRYFELQDVPGRTEIEIHPANKVEQLQGCLAPCIDFHRKTKTAIRSREACELIKSFFYSHSWVLHIIEVN
ncbi:DUF5675 family protein [Glaciecola sp. 2405UD65-10]|uniref:DUF5675 family protein n=1 Tax=Glaciecola sp. 2405UD65-10 TaxID=3397244 RepID=UPI003B5CFB67